MNCRMCDLLRIKNSKQRNKITRRLNQIKRYEAKYNRYSKIIVYPEGVTSKVYYLYTFSELIEHPWCLIDGYSV